MIDELRRFINPPYNIKEISIMLGLVIMLLAIPLTVIATRQSRTLTPKAQQFYPISLTAQPAPLSSLGNHGIEFNWSPITEGSGASLMIWNGNKCKSIAGGYDSGDLAASVGTGTKTSYVYTNVGLKPGNIYCGQIWEDFYGGKLGSNAILAQVPTVTLKAESAPLSSKGNYGIKYTWEPGLPSGVDASLMIWNGRECPVKAPTDPGLLAKSINVGTSTSVVFSDSQVKIGNTYCAQIWEDFESRKVTSNPTIHTVIAVGDSDNDGFSDRLELFLGTNVQKACPKNAKANNEDPDSWPPDFDDDKDVDDQDVTIGFSDKINKPENYDKRSDFDMDGDIDIIDVLIAYKDPDSGKSLMYTKCSNKKR